MSYTEPNPQKGYIESTLQTKAEIVFKYTTLPEGERSGNTFTFFNALRPATALVNGDALPTDRQNSTGSVQLYDYATRYFMTGSEYNRFKTFPGSRTAQGDKMAEALTIGMEVALDTVLNAATNTLSLATDNTMTYALFAQALAMLSQYGASLSDCVYVTSSTLAAATLLASAQANAGGSLGSIDGLQFAYGSVNRVPVYVDTNFTNSGSTGATSGYLWAKGAVLGGIDALQVHEPTFSSIHGGYDFTGSLGYGFTARTGVAEPLIVRFVNP